VCNNDFYCGAFRRQLTEEEMATTFEATKNGILTNGNHVEIKSDQYAIQQNEIKEEAENALLMDTNGDSAEPEEDVPEIDIEISNVVCSFSVRCHLNLREIALKGCNVEYRREQGVGVNSFSDFNSVVVECITWLWLLSYL
jgi:Transcription factor TFIID (or TATA-binding protein, TBP)